LAKLSLLIETVVIVLPQIADKWNSAVEIPPAKERGVLRDLIVGDVEGWDTSSRLFML
jgi:hypothetical protein